MPGPGNNANTSTNEIGPIQTFATGVYGSFAFRARDYGDFTAVNAYTNSGITSFSINYMAWGVHNNEQGSFKVEVEDTETDEIVRSVYHYTDVPSMTPLTVTNVVPGRTYTIRMVSLTDNDMDGGFYVHIDGYAYD